MCLKILFAEMRLAVFYDIVGGDTFFHYALTTESVLSYSYIILLPRYLFHIIHALNFIIIRQQFNILVCKYYYYPLYKILQISYITKITSKYAYEFHIRRGYTP